MEKIYTLSELEAMKEATKKVIGERIKELTDEHGAMTARELEAELGGLCNKYNISALCNQHGIGRMGNTRITRRGTTRVIVKRMAELDENDNIIRIFEVQQSQEIYEYKAGR